MPPKRKAEEEDFEEEGEDVVDLDDDEKPKPKKPRAPAKKKEPAAAAGGAGAAAPAKAKRAPKAKELTPEEQKLAAEASMERNAAVVGYLASVAQGYRDEQSWIKAAAAKKAKDSVAALKEPFRLPKDLLVLDGIGKGTVEKIQNFLLDNPGAGVGAGAVAKVAAAGGAEDLSWIESSDRDVVLGLLRDGGLTLEQVAQYRSDITKADI